MERNQDIVIRDPSDSLPPDYVEFDIAYSCGLDDSIVYIYNEKTEEDYRKVCNHYEEMGYGIYGRTAMGENRATTFIRGTEMAHIYWFRYEHELSVVISATAAVTLPPNNTSAQERVSACTVAQINNFGGMAYVIQLCDGSYIIYDGGYASDLPHLHDYLQKNHCGHGKPLVRAWVITHSHNDHYPVFSEYCRNEFYRNSIKLNYVIVSPLNAETFDLDPQNEKGYLPYHLMGDAAAFEDAQVVVAHTGMEFSFGELKMEMLLTPENLFKGVTTLKNTNDSSIVSRLCGDGYSALFLGDIMRVGTDFMVKQYGSYLQSDMCQISHHGCDDVPASFYDVVRAPIAFYPCDEGAYDYFPFNRDVRDAVRNASYTKEILIANLGLFVRPWGARFAEDAPLSIPGYTPPRPLPPHEIPADPELAYVLTNISDWPGWKLGYVRIESEVDGTDRNWFILGFGSNVQIGNYDLSTVKAIQFDLFRKDTPQGHSSNVLRFCTDMYNLGILAECRLPAATEDNQKVTTIRVDIQKDYNGPLCIRLGGETQAVYAFSNFRFYKR